MKFKLNTHLEGHDGPVATAPITETSLDLRTAKRLLTRALLSLAEERLEAGDAPTTLIWAEVVVDDPGIVHQIEAVSTTVGAYSKRQFIDLDRDTLLAMDFYTGISILEQIGWWMRSDAYPETTFNAWIQAQANGDHFEQTNDI